MHAGLYLEHFFGGGGGGEVPCTPTSGQKFCTMLVIAEHTRKRKYEKRESLAHLGIAMVQRVLST